MNNLRFLTPEYSDTAENSSLLFRVFYLGFLASCPADVKNLPNALRRSCLCGAPLSQGFWFLSSGCLATLCSALLSLPHSHPSRLENASRVKAAYTMWTHLSVSSSGPLSPSCLGSSPVPSNRFLLYLFGFSVVLSGSMTCCKLLLHSRKYKFLS